MTNYFGLTMLAKNYISFILFSRIKINHINKYIAYDLKEI